jgi:AcrR family transcriptional regulator
MASDKKSHILAAAQRLFQEKGLGRSTMEDVAKAAGMGKSSLYYYFKSQEEIFDAVLEVEIGEILQETIRQMSKQNGLLAKLNAFAMAKFDMTRKRKSLYRATESGMDAEALSRYQKLKRIVHLRYLQKESLLLQQLLISGNVDKEIKALNPEALDQAIFIFLSALRGMNREIILYGDAEEATNRLTSFCAIFIRGLA